MARVIVANARTGDRILDVPYLDYRWSSPLNGLDTVSVKVTLRDPDVRKLNLPSAAAPGKATVHIVEGDVFLASAFVWWHDWDEDSDHLEFGGTGYGSYFARRVILPTNAENPDPIILTADLTTPVGTEEEPREAGDSNPATDTTISGWDLGTIGAKLCQLMLAHAGSPEFFVFPADRAGFRERTFKGSELKNGWDAVSSLSDVEGGPDIRFETRWTEDRLGVEVHYRSGSETEPRLYPTGLTHRWDKSVPESSVTGLKIRTSADSMGSRAWVSGGRSVNQALIVTAINSRLLDEGYPLLEIDDAHPTASEAGTLRGYANGLVADGAVAGEEWSFEVRTDQPPVLGVYAPGDLFDIVIGANSYKPADTYRKRILALSGSAGVRKVSVTAGEVD